MEQHGEPPRGGFKPITAIKPLRRPQFNKLLLCKNKRRIRRELMHKDACFIFVLIEAADSPGFLLVSASESVLAENDMIPHPPLVKHSVPC